VGAGLTLHEHLRPLLAKYLRHAPAVNHPLPLITITDAGTVDIAAPADPRSPADRILDDLTFDGHDGADARDPLVADARFLRTEMDTRAALAAREVEELETEGRGIEKQMRETQEQLEATQREQDEAMAAGTAALQNREASPAPTRTIESGPSQGSILAYRAGELVLLFSEAMQIAIPFMATAGVDVSALNVEFARNPWTVLGWSVTAVGLAITLFMLTRIVLEKGAELIDTREYNATRPYVTAGVVAAAAIVLGALWAITSLRSHVGASAGALNAALYDAPSRASIPTLTYFVVSLAMIVGAAQFHRCANRLGAERADALRRAATPTAEEAAFALRAATLAVIADVRAQLQHRREVVTARMRAVTDEAHAAEQNLRKSALDGRVASDTFVVDVKAALAKDRYYFLLIAKRRKRLELVPPDSMAPPPAGGTLVRLPRVRRSS
jgi:hypothetical protein